MVAAGPVDVTVRELFFGRGAHGGDFHFEVEGLAREWMIAIECHQVATRLGDADDARALRRVGLQPHADPYLADAFERTSRHALYELTVVLAVAFGREDFHL